MNEKKDRFTRTDMQEQDSLVRAKNFIEVPLGYTEKEATLEAKRCLQCKKPLCIAGCPVAVKIPEFIDCIAKRDYKVAALKLKETNALPAVCGRVCPQEEQCEIRCILEKKGAPIAIGNLERFAADWERENSEITMPEIDPKNGKMVAIVGSGPAGLTAAGDLAIKGFDVTIFEALHESGGVLVYGIPEFRLPKAIVKIEIDYLKRLGVKIVYNFIVGRTATVDDLLTEEGFDAVFIGTGAGLPVFMNLPGENSVGVYSANEYLTRVNLMKAYKKNSTTPIHRGRRVITVGGGNVAMDAARTALRIGAEESTIVYRRGMKELPARKMEVHHATQEGVEFHTLANPLEILSNEFGRVTGLKCIKMELGEPDDSGRCRPIPIKGSEFALECDIVIIAIGNRSNPLIKDTTPDISHSNRGTIIEKNNDGRTSKKYVYAGGDIVTGAATVILAMGQGKQAAVSICEDLL